VSGLKWQEPPSTPRHNWDSIAEQLKANPGRWALVAESYSGNKVKAAKARGLTVRVSRVPENFGKFDVYAKYDA